MAPSQSTDRRWARRVGGLVAPLVTLALLAGCGDSGGRPLDTLDPKGDNARVIDDLAKPMFIAAGVVGVLVFAAVGYILFRFRARKGDEAEEVPAQLHGNTTLELAWTAIPALILLAFAVPTIVVIADLNAAEDDALKVKVEGQQWWWQFTYDTDGDGEFGTAGDVVTATELVIPAETNIELTITSNDVIHSFWIPGLNGKRDAVPGLDSFWKLHADAPGMYLGQCTEFCGLSHANMRMLVRAYDQATYEQWVEDQLRPVTLGDLSEEAQAGAEAFVGLCSGCHLVDGVNNSEWKRAGELVSGVAPNLTHFASRGTFAGAILNLHEVPDGGVVGDPALPIDPTELEAWLRDPEAEKPMAPDEGRGMPNFGLTEQQIDDLVAFLTELD